MLKNGLLRYEKWKYFVEMKFVDVEKNFGNKFKITIK
jgi:hypothetical protein